MNDYYIFSICSSIFSFLCVEGLSDSLNFDSIFDHPFLLFDVHSNHFLSLREQTLLWVLLHFKTPK